MMRRLGVLTLVVGGLAAGTALALQQPAKKAYIVVQVEVTNPQQYGEYTKLSPAIIERVRRALPGPRWTRRHAGRAASPQPRRRHRIPELRAREAVLRLARLRRGEKGRAGAADAQFILVEGQ